MHAAAAFAHGEVLPPPASWPAAPVVCVVIPTLNEEQNVRPLYERLKLALNDVAWEAVFVDDDSSDATRTELTSLARNDHRVRLLHRIDRRGLSSACVEGMLASTAPYLVVMDADLQHDERLIPTMLDCLIQEPVDIVLGSRFKQGSLCTGLSARREKLSELGIRLANRVLHAELTDPLTGFFAMRRDVLLQVVDRLCLKGFKIVVDILASSPRRLRCKEIPMRFRERLNGASKLDTVIHAEFLFVLADKLVGRLVPVRFLVFVLVGLTGVLMHLAALTLLYRWAELPFLAAQAAATYAAMISNFCLNNHLTYHDLRLRGGAFYWGLLSFCVICSVGASANFTVADALFSRNVPWALAGLLGAVIGAVWNYGVTSTLTWRSRARPRSSGALSERSAGVSL